MGKAVEVSYRLIEESIPSHPPLTAPTPERHTHRPTRELHKTGDKAMESTAERECVGGGGWSGVERSELRWNARREDCSSEKIWIGLNCIGMNGCMPDTERKGWDTLNIVNQ